MGSGFTSTRVPPPLRVASGIEAAGWTTALVPTTRQTSASPASVKARPSRSGCSPSPNQTTSGRRSAPQGGGQCGREAALVASTATSRPSVRRPQRVHRSPNSAPCSVSGRAAAGSRPPAAATAARSWRPSTFCVTMAARPESARRASASWPGFGTHLATTSRRHWYQLQTSTGSRANAWGVASSSGRWRRQRPSSPRKVGTPDSAEIPAPVSTSTRRASPSRRRAASSGAVTRAAPSRPGGPRRRGSRARRTV